MISTIEEINKYLRANGTLQPESILPFVPDAVEQYLKPYAGDKLVEDVTLMASNGVMCDEFLALDADIQNMLLWHCQGIVARFAFFIGAPSLDIQITESGFAVISNTNLAPASKDRVEKFITSVERLGWQSIEMFLKYLDDKKAELAAYHEEHVIPAYGDEWDLFINSALDFDRYFKIDKSRLLFQKLQPVMQTVEQLRIEPVLSLDLCVAFKNEVADGSLAARTRIVLPLIKKAVVYFTVCEDLYEFFPKSLYEFKYTELWKAFIHDEKQKYADLGEKYLSMAKNYILAHVDNYPEYVASEVYEDVTERVNLFENTEDDKFYTFQ